ncbi:MAG: hypothetical protein NVSMB14_09700 [Isosphaeraceae bacterium]
MAVEEFMEPTSPRALMIEVARFHDWALRYNPSDGRYEYVRRRALGALNRIVCF